MASQMPQPDDLASLAEGRAVAGHRWTRQSSLRGTVHCRLAGVKWRPRSRRRLLPQSIGHSHPLGDRLSQLIKDNSPSLS